jgi:hypothetical protein
MVFATEDVLQPAAAARSFLLYLRLFSGKAPNA